MGFDSGLLLSIYIIILSWGEFVVGYFFVLNYFHYEKLEVWFLVNKRMSLKVQRSRVKP